MFGQLDYKKALSYRLLIVLLVAWAGTCLWRILAQGTPFNIARVLLSGIGIVASFWIAVSAEAQMWDLVMTTADYRQGASNRGSRVTGKVIGGLPSGGIMIGKKTHSLPVVEFAVGNETFYAVGPRPRAVQLVRDDGAELTWGKDDILYVPAKDILRDARSCRMVTDDALEKFLSDDIESGEDWMSWRYGESVLSQLFPVGSEMEVAYDSDDPRSGHRVITPNGKEPFVGGAFSHDSLVSISCMLALAIGTALLSFVTIV